MAISRHNSPENRDIFVVDGEPVSFYLWGTGRDEGPGWALSEGQRESLTQRIEYYGGRVCDSLRGVNTIIVQERGLVELRERYVLVRDCYVEPPSFVPACIRNRKYAHEAPRQHPRAMGGRTPGTYRVNFTKSDDDHMCQFLSTAIPYPEAGGRQGNKVWQLLTQNALYVPELKWAKRHTWQSWRERYKKHRERFDPIIDAMVKKHPPPPDGKGLFPYDRRVNGQHFDPFLLQREEEEEDDDDQGEFQRTPDDEEEEEEEFDDHPDDVHFEQDVSRGHARRQTDPGPRRATSSAEPRGRPRTRAGPRQVERTTPDEVAEYHDFDYQPGEDIAGPSGTQGNPLQSPIPPSPPRQPTRRTVAPRPVARPSAPAVMERRATQMPMSSQATLVGPVPTQLRGVSTSQKQQQQAQAGPGPSTLALRQIGVRAASRANAVAANDDEEDEEDEDEDEDQELSEEEPQSHTHGQTNEEEQDVEDILDESYEQSAPDPEGEVEVEAGLEDEEVEVEVVDDLEGEEPEEDEDEIAPSMEVQLDSDDERTRRKLLDSRPRQAAQAGTSRTKSSRKRAAPQQDDDDDDIEFAESLDIDNPAPRRSSVVPSASPVRRSLAPATPRSASGRETRAETDPGYTSSESAVPLPNTKASAEKKRRRIEERYEPPAGTRAAEVSARRPAPKAPSPQVRQLRSRTVQRR